MSDFLTCNLCNKSFEPQAIYNHQCEALPAQRIVVLEAKVQTLEARLLVLEKRLDERDHC